MQMVGLQHSVVDLVHHPLQPTPQHSPELAGLSQSRQHTFARSSSWWGTKQNLAIRMTEKIQQTKLTRMTEKIQQTNLIRMTEKIQQINLT